MTESLLGWFRTLETAIEEWDAAPHAEDLAKAEAERASILARYPLATWSSMGVEDFAQGTGGESFCSWMEHSSPHIARLPARHAGIHLIYKEGGEHWRFPKGYKTVDDAWTAIRGGYVEAFGLTGNGDYAGVDKLAVFKPGRLTLNKALHVYFPDRLLPIAATSHLKVMAERVFRGSWTHSHARMGHCELSSSLLAALRKHPKLTPLSTVELMRFLYDWTDPRKIPAVLKVAPGDGAKYWKDCRDGGYICVGWDEVGDLTKFDGLREYKAAFLKEFSDFYKGHTPTISRKAKEPWLLRETGEGTLVLANKGQSEVLAVGRVSGSYRWMPARKEYKHTLPVDWSDDLAGPVPNQGYWGLNTVLAIPPSQFDGILGHLVGTPPKPEGYDFFKYPALDAHIGLAVNDTEVAVYLPPQGGTTAGDRRNPDRREFFERLLGKLTSELPLATVRATKGGPASSPVRPVDSTLSENAGAALADEFRAAQAFRFDFWLRLRSATPVAELAERLGLEAVSHRSIDVSWPDLSTPPRDPCWWIFQADLRRYDLDRAVQALESVSWQVNQHADEIRPGDRVFLWASGETAGIRALATVVGAPREQDFEDDGFAVGDAHGLSDRRVRCDLRIDQALPEPVYAARIKSSPGLEKLSILRNARGTNFNVSEAEAGLLLAAVRAGPDIEAEEPPTFDDVLQHLRDQGLYFAEETVANFLLALQAKRFVILTGISGTGKTQLAMSIADRFPLTERVIEEADELPDDALSITVQPYMLKYNRFVLPAEFAAGVPELEGLEGSTTMLVHYPGGSIELSVYNPGRYTLVGLKKGVRKWFTSSLVEGQTFVVELLEDEGERSALRLRLPSSRTVRTRTVAHAEVVAVRPDWTDNRGLLGYLNPITGRYVVEPFLDLLLRADSEARRAKENRRTPRPFFAVLDEMNLARVEHYFSDFLSALESEKPLPLHGSLSIELGEDEHLVRVPRRLSIPPNLFFVGTVNVDETTYMFSPKVLDRAFTIELNDVSLAGLGGDDPETSPLRLDDWSGRLVPPGKPESSDWKKFGEELPQLRDHVVRMHEVLADENRHFGYRVANEIARYVLLAKQQASHADAPSIALDLALLQKVLPKLHGTQQELTELVDRLLAFALGEESAEALAAWDWNPSSGWQLTTGDNKKAQGTPVFPRTARKLWRMRRRLDGQGFAAFVE